MPQPTDRADSADKTNRMTVVVVGNGMVGLRFCEDLCDADWSDRFDIVAIGEEPHAAYDRVHLSDFFSGRSAEDLTLAPVEWYEDKGIPLHRNERVVSIDRNARCVSTGRGRRFRYDALVLATGSSPFVPPIAGRDRPGVFVYRTIEDVEAIREYAAHARVGAVLGGGLLGLEAAKALVDLGLETHVIEFAPRLMPRQLDSCGAEMLARSIRELGVHVHVDQNTQEIRGNGRAQSLHFADGRALDVDMVVISAGIRPNDELARTADLTVGDRGGFVVDDSLRTSDPLIYAIGECALWNGSIYGLVGPGYSMARIVADILTGGDARFSGWCSGSPTATAPTLRLRMTTTMSTTTRRRAPSTARTPGRSS